jgi:hypothetical protein
MKVNAIKIIDSLGKLQGLMSEYSAALHYVTVHISQG